TRLHLPSDRARLRPVCACGAPGPPLRRRARARHAGQRRAACLDPEDPRSPRTNDRDSHQGWGWIGPSRLSRPTMSTVRILFIGDIVGRPGRELVRRGLSALVEHHAIDLVIANVENAAAGFGITREIGDQLLDWGVGVMTSGNHIWDKKEALDYIGAEARLLRPANFPAGAPGNGRYLARSDAGHSVGVINVMGRIFMLPIDDPFAVVLREIEALRARTRVIVVDFHAEATSEKIAMGWHLDGQVTALIGTHTHVQTADERILPKGTELTVGVTDLLEREFSEIWVEGGLSNCRLWNSAPLFFTLKEAASQIRAVICRAALR